LAEAPKMDSIILTVAHDIFKGISLDSLRNIMSSHPIIIDVQGVFDIPEIHNSGIVYRRL